MITSFCVLCIMYFKFALNNKLLILLCFSFLTAVIFISPIKAQTLNIDNNVEWNSGEHQNTVTLSSGIGIEIESYGTWGALTWMTPDKTLSIGSTFTTDGESIYVARGVGDNLFWKYSPVKNSWTTLKNLPRGAYYGADIMYLDNYIYMLFGGYQDSFARYNIELNEWEMLKDYPELVYQGASLTTDGSDIYSVASNNTQSFYRYNVEEDTWSLLASTPATLRAGSDLVYDTGYIYTPRGNNTNTFYRYNIGANTWATLANVPGLLNDDNDITIAGSNIYVARLNNTADFYKYNISSNTWSTLTPAPLASRYTGVVYLSSDQYIYFFRGNGDYRFWKYDIGSNSFLGPSESPATLGLGSDMLLSNGAVFTTRGVNTTTLYKYTIATNAWSTLATAPASFNDDTRGEVVGDNIYFLRGSSTATFYKYTISTNTWTTLTNSPAITRAGAAIAYPGSGDYIYILRGNTTNTFWRFNINTETWDAPLATLPTGIVAANGATLTSDGTDIYFTAGIGIKRMFKYVTSTNTWSELSLLPFSTFSGTDVTYIGGGKMVAVAGWYRNEIWEYTISTNTWRKLKSFQPYGPFSVGAYSGTSLTYIGNNNLLLSRGNGTQEMLIYTVGSSNYESSGTYISSVSDLSYVSGWSSINISSTTPSDSSILIQTRTSSDQITWTSWQSLSIGQIASPTNRYIQFKVILYASSSLTATPTLKSISVEYIGDNTDPSVISNVTGYSQEIDGVEIESSQSYTHLYPYFSWDPSDDNGTGILGYYVYFGTDPIADPLIYGAFQSSNTFGVTEGMEIGSNYLRIVSKDIAGNTSSVVDAFEYIYSGIAPVHDLDVFNDDLTGTNVNTQKTSEGIQLLSIGSGFWREERLTPAPINLGYGAKNVGYVVSTNKLYITSGMNDRLFYEYNITTDTWTRLTDTPSAVYYGGGAVAGPDGYIYVAAGGNTTNYWRYDISTNTWDNTIPSAPLTVGYGGSLVYDNEQYIYILRGNNTDTFWRYDTYTDIWENLSRVDFGAPITAATNNVYSGGFLTIDIQNELIYAIQGNSFPGFAVYDINRDVWEELPITPSLPNLGAAIALHSSSNTIYYTGGNSNPYFFKYDIDSGEWTEINSSPIGFNYGGALKVVGDQIIAIRGNNTNTIYKYNIAKDCWFIPRRGLFGRVFEGSNLFNTNYGADILKGDGSNYYITRGNYADNFVRWNEITGEIINLADLPVGTYGGSSMVYENTNNLIYLTAGIYDRGFFTYDITNNTWTEQTLDKVPVVANYGSSMVYDGSRYIYLNIGGGTNTFYRYDTQASAGSRWATRANTPSGLNYGAELLLKDGYIYTLQGNNVNNNPFYRYNISTNAWSVMAPFPTNVYNDGFLVDGGNGYFYAAKGSNTNSYYKYSIASNTWQSTPNMPGQIYAGGSGESNANNSIYVIPGTGTNTYQDSIYSYILASDSSSFEKNGAYTSQTHDLNSVYRWAGIRVDHEINDNTNLVIETSTSLDNINWSSWSSVTKERIVEGDHYYKISSAPGRYIKFRFTFSSSDGIRTATIHDYSIYYYQDIDPPTNPDITGFSAYSSSEGDAITSDTWYNHTSPFFSWALNGEVLGASDGANGSGVSGYMIYWGDDTDADPALVGSFQNGNSFVPPTLTSGTTYYLRIKTKDNAGNYSTESFSPFIYNYDSIGPDSPSNLNADPSGYTATDSFSFSWDPVIGEGAPVSEYCYKTMATSGPYSIDQCIVATNIDNIPSYKVGSNTFQVKAKDSAGNYSSYTSIPYYFVDSAHAPAPPTDLQVQPVSSTQNSFGFTWDAPLVGTYYGSESNLSYLYSVNALPTEHSTSKTSLKYLNPGAYATLPGENKFYIITQDEAGNVNYSDYASISFFANTIAPGIPMNIEIADVSVKSTSSWRLAISWDPPENAGSGVGGYQIYRSVNGTDFFYHSFTSGESLVDSKLIQMTYYYKVKACDNTNNCGAFSEIVSLYPDGRFTEPAQLIVEPLESGISPRKATISWVTARTADSKIAYGIEPGVYFETEISNSDQVVDHILTIPNLSPGTIYYYVAKWTDEDGNTGVSTEMTFETYPAPAIEEPVARSIGLNSAYIEFKTKGSSKVRIFYGETSAFGGMVEIYTGSEEGVHSSELKDLKDGTKYYYKINTFDIDGFEYEGEMHSFETLPRPQILDPKIFQISGTSTTSLLIEWDVNTPITSIITYYPSNNPAQAKDEVNVALKSGKHRMVLLDLYANTSYVIIIRGRDFKGNEATTGVIPFTTASDTRPPSVYDLQISSEIIGSGQEATAQLVVTYKTDEPATSQVEFGEGTGTNYSQKTQEDKSLAQNHLVIISGLTPSKVYHLRAISYDEQGNEGVSIDKVIVSSSSTENALDLVIKNLTSIFAFLND